MTLPLLRLRQDHGAGDDGTVVTPEPPQAARQETAPAQPAAPAVPGGTRVTIIGHAFRMARRHAGEMAGREGTWVSAALEGRPPSVGGQRDYLARRRWLPPGHEGGIADALGEGYHVAYGIPGVAIGNFISWLLSRPFRSAWAAVILLAALFGGCEMAGLRPAAGALAVLALAGALAGWLALVTGLLALRRAIARRMAGLPAAAQDRREQED